MLLYTRVSAQEEVPLPDIEQQFENLAEADESETQDDSYWQQMQAFRRRPLDINAATESDLQVFRWLTDLQIQNLLEYRRLLGRLHNVLELQAVPGWDIETIARTRPFITAGNGQGPAQMLRQRLRNGEHSLLIRFSRFLETQRGFIPRDTLPPNYAGGPWRTLVRYKYNYKNTLQYGVLGEKDPGEQFGKGAQRGGFDFYSAHFFVRNYGKIHLLALGDYTVNMGQGLLVYQSLAFRKSVDVMNIKRQTDLFRPYNSPAEFNFFRGAAIAMQFGRWYVGVFGAHQRISGNAVVAEEDSSLSVTSLNASGLFRTRGEIEDRFGIRQTAAGGSLQYRQRRWRAGVNAVHYQLSAPLNRNPVPYNQFAFNSRSLTGISADYSYTYRNLHAFGEIATNPGNDAIAAVHGLLLNVHRQVDFSLLHRSIGKSYQSLYARAFTEGTNPINERGLYTGMSIRPHPHWRLDMYADVFSFPWLRFRVDRPSHGHEYLVQATWKPNKQWEAYMRFRNEKKALNLSNNPLNLPQTEDFIRQNWRLQVSYKISPTFTTRMRTEAVWFDKGGPAASQGVLLFADLFYKPLGKPIAANVRWQFFETDDFNGRLYAYENDILYSYSIPVFSGKGHRAYLNINYDITRRITAWVRIGQTFYPDQKTIGSGNDLIQGNRRTDLRMQVRFAF